MKQRQIAFRKNCRGYAMIVALVALLVMTSLAGILIHTAAVLQEQTYTAANQNAQCSLVVETVALHLRSSLDGMYQDRGESGPDVFRQKLFEAIDSQRWRDYYPTASAESAHGPIAIHSFSVDLVGSREESREALGQYAVALRIYWESASPGSAYINNDNRELVIEITCTSTDGGYAGLILRFENRIEEIGEGTGVFRWLGDWDYLWSEEM